MANDPFHLQRFVSAQDGVFAQALAELKAGHKRTHWMWFVFPQLRGLGLSAMADRYGIVSLPEAKAYLDHSLLGQRLSACVEAVLAVQGRTLQQIFGSPDDAKFRSSMTLFSRAALSEADMFEQALDRYCGGKPDERTLALLNTADSA